MAASATTLRAGDRLPNRGRAKKTIILDAIRAQSLLGTNKDSTAAEVEDAFFGHMAVKATTPDDPNSGMLLKLLTDKGWSSLKPTAELVNFEFDANLKPHLQAAQVLQAASEGVIPSDIAQTFISSIKSMIDIEEYTELKGRIEKIEKVLTGES